MWATGSRCLWTLSTASAFDCVACDRGRATGVHGSQLGQAEDDEGPV